MNKYFVTPLITSSLEVRTPIISDSMDSKHIGMIEYYSNPHIVFQKARKLFGNDVNIRLSTRKDKKYMLLNPNIDKWIHFGKMGMEDYTKHKNLIRRDKFRLRNHKWAEQDFYTPGYLSFYLLW